MFENIAAIEVAFMIKEVVDRGMGGGEFLEGADVPEPRHRFFPSSEWLVRIFDPVVKPTAAFLAGDIADHLHRRAV